MTQRSRASTFAVSIATLTAVGGCADVARQGHLYPRREGAPSAVVLRAAHADQGRADARLASGERCSGEFATTPGDVTRSENGREILREESQAGLLVLTCGTGNLIACSFTRDPWAGGHGSCKDSRGAEYSLVF